MSPTKTKSRHRSLLAGILRRTAPLIPDKLFLQLMFYARMGRKLDLKNPKSFNEKLQWLKLYNRNPEYTKMVDKYEAKEYVASIIGNEFIIPTIGIYNTVDEIPWESLPNQFVLKCTHDSGGIVICKDKNTLDIEEAKKKLSKGLSKTYFYQNREWPYRNVKPRIICEKYMVDESGYELKDYKFFCFNGTPKIFKVDFNRTCGHRANYYDLDWNLLEFGEVKFPFDPERKIEKPLNFELMVKIAAKLSRDIPFVRVDLYNTNGKIFFGELTFFPSSGSGRFSDDKWDKTLGDWVTLYPHVIFGRLHAYEKFTSAEI